MGRSRFVSQSWTFRGAILSSIKRFLEHPEPSVTSHGTWWSKCHLVVIEWSVKKRLHEVHQICDPASSVCPCLQNPHYRWAGRRYIQIVPLCVGEVRCAKPGLHAISFFTLITRLESMTLRLCFLTSVSLMSW